MTKKQRNEMVEKIMMAIDLFARDIKSDVNETVKSLYFKAGDGMTEIYLDKGFLVKMADANVKCPEFYFKLFRGSDAIEPLEKVSFVRQASGETTMFFYTRSSDTVYAARLFKWDGEWTGLSDDKIEAIALILGC